MYEEHPSFVLPENSDEKTIWRYMDLPKFISLIHKRSLFFTKASKLSDPYEGTVPKYWHKMRRAIYEPTKQEFKKVQFDRFINNSPEISESSPAQKRELLLINSWHFSEYESAAFWELYSTKAGIAIQSTIKELKDSFAKNYNDTIWIGAIKYNYDYIDEWNIYEPFLIKRPSFSHEKEIRAVTSLPDEKLGKKVFSDSDCIPRVIDRIELTDHGKYVKVDLEKLINKIYVSPKAPAYFKEVVESIISKYGLSKEIIKSDLYTLK